jgi:hypothetical protein
MHVAVLNEHISKWTVASLLDRGGDPAALDRNFKTILHYTAEKLGDLRFRAHQHELCSIVQLLLRQPPGISGGLIYIQDVNGKTPRDLLVAGDFQSDSTRLATLLLEGGPISLETTSASDRKAREITSKQSNKRTR